MLDIDKGSPYHPGRDPLALGRLQEALEPLGLVRSLIVTSSDSGGLHVYYPFDKPLPCYKIAIAIAISLEHAGFKLAAGLLEVFPNPRPFTSDGSISLYNGHRLPLQYGSYLLDGDLNPVSSAKSLFAERWAIVASHNLLDLATVARLIKLSRSRAHKVTGKAAKYLADLNTAIEVGWTGPGQTNALLGLITRREYIFHHVIHGGAPLSGQALAAAIAAVAVALPGYQEWCGHKDEISKKAAEWARCIEAKPYFYPYGTKKQNSEAEQPPAPSWHQQQQEKARQRIESLVSSLKNAGKWCVGITDRVKALIAFGFSKSTLYRHKDLWHPGHEPAVEIPPDPPIQPERVLGEEEPEGLPAQRQNLLGDNSRTSLPSKGLSTSTDKASTPPGCTDIKARLLALRSQQQEAAARRRQEQAARHEHAMWTRMMDYLLSGDAILMREAEAWFAAMDSGGA